MRIRVFAESDHAEWRKMRCALWPDAAEADAVTWLLRKDAIIFVAELDPADGLIGFVEAGERAYADGCSTSPVAFVEGWYVEAEQRRNGIGAALIMAVEQWASSRGLKELASDSLLENTGSLAAHYALGFQEVERAVRYRKPLS